MRETTYVNPTGEAPGPMSIESLAKWLNDREGIAEIPEAVAVRDQFRPTDFYWHMGHFLIDPAGVVRWVQVETPANDLSRTGVFPSDDEILAAARAAAL